MNERQLRQQRIAPELVLARGSDLSRVCRNELAPQALGQKLPYWHAAAMAEEGEEESEDDYVTVSAGSPTCRSTGFAAPVSITHPSYPLETCDIRPGRPGAISGGSYHLLPCAACHHRAGAAGC